LWSPPLQGGHKTRPYGLRAKAMYHILHTYGYPLVFAAVLAENLGLPVPSFFVVLFAAAMGAQDRFTIPGLLAVSLTAALIGDFVWYGLGRVRGRPILRTLCSLSLNADSCVSRTESLFERHGLKSLLVAKFLPGLNTIGAPLAGMLKLSPVRFGLFDLGGAGLWAGAALALGVAFRSELDWLTAWLLAFGQMGGLILVCVFLGWIALKWVERRRFYQLLERSRVTAAELKELMEKGEALVVVDLRSSLSVSAEGVKIPGAIHIPPHEFSSRHKDIPTGRPVVMVCT